MNNASLPLKVSAVLAALFGGMLLFAPNELVAVYKGTHLSSSGLYNSMLYGAALLGLAVVNWGVADSENTHEMHHVLLGNLVIDALGLAVAIERQLRDPETPAFAWFNVALFLVLAVWFAWMVYREMHEGLTSPPHGLQH